MTDGFHFMTDPTRRGVMFVIRPAEVKLIDARIYFSGQYALVAK